MHLAKFVHTKTGRYVMSVLLGIGLASLFRVVCKDKNCIILKAKNSIDSNDVYQFNKKCYKFNSVSTSCDKSKKNVLFE